jgi:hypothetical protein
MKKPALIFCCLGVLAIVSCGGGNPTKTAPVAFAPLNGNFSFKATSQALAPNVIFIGGPLQTDANGQISGTLGVSNSVSNCIALGTTAMFTGSEGPQNQVMLTSAPINGQVITLNTTVSSDGNFFSAGSYSVTGGCLAGDQGSMQAQHLLTGTYAGSVLINGNPINVTLNFTAPGNPDASGAFPLRAGATFTNTSACGGFTALATEGGSQTGLNVGFTLGAGANPVVSFGGTTIDGSSTMLQGTMGISGGACDQMSGTITLKKL